MNKKIRFFDKLKKQIFTSDECNSYEVWDLVMDEDRFISMGLTGLKDKNGRDIYEGDLLKLNNETKGEIIFQDAQFLMKCSVVTLGLSNSNFHYEIIGNIYENPELLSKAPKGFVLVGDYKFVAKGKVLDVNTNEEFDAELRFTGKTAGVETTEINGVMKDEVHTEIVPDESGTPWELVILDGK